MSPKRRVAVMSGVFAVLGVGVSVAIIAANGGFSADGPNIIDPPTADDIWVVGSNIQDGTMLEYSLDAKGPSSELRSSTVSLDFMDAGNSWNVTFNIANGTASSIEKTIVMSKELTREGELDAEFGAYFEPIQESLLAVRDMEYGSSPKYLVIGAPWNVIFVGATSATVRVTAEERIETGAGAFDSFVLTYKLNDNTSRIWMVDSMPLPVKAEAFDADDQVQYRFELLRASGVESGS